MPFEPWSADGLEYKVHGEECWGTVLRIFENDVEPLLALAFGIARTRSVTMSLKTSTYRTEDGGDDEYVLVLDF